MADTVNTEKKRKLIPKISFDSIIPEFKKWAYKNRYYILAFFIPALIVYIAYAMFNIYPFGDNSVLVLDLNGQYISYFEALHDAFWSKESILYNWSRNLSGGYMGVIGYYLASPFTLIVMILPRKMILGSLLIMQMCKIGASGVTFSLFLQKTKNAKPVNALIFSTMYALMAYAIIQLMDPMWLDGLVFLPLIMMGVEYLVDSKKKLHYIIPLALMFIANFYIGYMIGIFTFIYFVYYVFFGTNKIKKSAYEIFGITVRFGLCTAVSLMCAAVMLIPMYYALKLGKFEFTTPDFSFKLQFTALDFLPKLLPSSYDTVRNEGMPEIYCGMLTVLMLPLFYLNSKIPSRIKIGNSFLALIMFLSMYIKPIDMAWHGFQVPNWLPYRYSFIFSFIVLNMAAVAFENLDGISKRAVAGSFVGILAYLLYVDKAGYEKIETVGTIWFAIACIAAYSIVVTAIKDNEKAKVLPILLLMIVSSELVMDTYQTFKDIDKDVTYSKHSSYYPAINTGRQIVNEIEENDSGLYRSDKTFSRSSNDAGSYGLKGITHSSSVMNTRILKFIGALGYNQRSYYTRYNGATPISDSLLGFKYILDKDGKVSELYTKYAQSSDITVYQNPDALSIGYMVDDDILSLSSLSSTDPFVNQNQLLSTITGNNETTSEGTSAQNYFKQLSITSGPLFDDKILTQSSYGDQTKFEKTGTAGDATIEYHFTAKTSDPVYMFIYTRNEQKVNAWVSTTKDGSSELFKTGSFTSLGQYFETQFYSILKIGTFTPGQEVAIRLTIPGENTYTIYKDVLFYYLDQQLYKDTINTLKDQQFNITDYSGRKLEGTINAESGQVMMTSIPYESGWTVKVDGKKVKPVILMDSLIGIQLSPGEHEIKMSYIPQGFIPGFLLLIAGVGCIVFIYRYDKKKKAKSVKHG